MNKGSPDASGGRIVTFYSYKGGVGRSMALANVAYIAAMNNLRVLAMDWDLEAPGLGYYFRGLVDPQEARAIKTAPGILDLAWQWVETVRGVDDQAELGAYVEQVENGDFFDATVRTLLDEDYGTEGRLDILRAGSDHIGGQLSYEEALSIFSWPAFFNKDAGGIFMAALRGWAKENYDVVLIDSRTGLADVAGICTMQLPDVVALCFILNRQNMEGVAQVAGTVRAKRADEIKLRAVPMRLASRETSEEASARARARRELVVTGGFSPDAFDEDFKLLGIEASANVPFYEALAPIMANDPVKDPLSQNYLQLASGLLGRNLAMPVLYGELSDRVRRRLQPRHATADYLLELQETDPDRAFEEISQLVESALDAQLEHDDDLDEEYVEALVRAAFETGDAMGPPEGAELISQAADLVRARFAEEGGQWRPLLAEAIGKQLEYSAYIGDYDIELALLDEIETLLAADPTIAARLARLRHRRRAARVHINTGDAKAAFQALADAQALIESLEKSDLAPDQRAQREAAEVDSHLLRGDIYANIGPDPDLSRAVIEYRRGYALATAKATAGIRGETSRLRYDFAVRLATRFTQQLPVSDRAAFALEAARSAAGQSYAWLTFGELAEPILETGDGETLLAFVQSMLRHERHSIFASYQARHPRGGGYFLTTAGRIVETLADSRLPGWEEAARDMARVSVGVARMAARRPATMSARRDDRHLDVPLRFLIESLKQAKISVGIEELREIERTLSLRRRPTGGGQRE